MQTTRCWALWRLIFFFAVAGCIGVDGEDPYALWETYETPDRFFHFHYLSPPFEQVKGETDTVFAVESPSPVTGNVSARLRLEFKRFEQTDMDKAISDKTEEWQDDGFTVERARPFRSAGGDLGQRLVGQSGDKWIAAVFQSKDGDLASLEIKSKTAIETADITLLLMSLEPRSSRESRAQ